MEMFYVLILVVVVWVYTSVKTHWDVYLKSTSFIICKLNFNKDDFQKSGQKLFPNCGPKKNSIIG